MERRFKAFRVTGQMREELPEAIACMCEGFTVWDIHWDKLRDIYTYILYDKSFQIWPEGAELPWDIDFEIIKENDQIKEIRRTIRK